jgi:hypothetical protein
MMETPSDSTSFSFENTILWGNAGATPDCHTTGFAGIGSRGYNLFGAGCGGSGPGDITSTNAMLAPLADNGGPTWTHQLLPGSPALDVGNPAGCTDGKGNAISQDQRGMPRVSNGRCDIGAYEK